MLLARSVAPLAVLLLLVPSIAASAPGDLDAGFASGGIFTTTFNTPFYGQREQRVVVDAQNRPIVALTTTTFNGDTSTPSIQHVGVMRFTTAGVLDTTFNPTGTTPGFLDVDFGDLDCTDDVHARALALTPGGDIVVVADLCGGSFTSHTGVVRLTDTGAFDPGFSGDGKLSVFSGTVGLIPSFAEDVEVDSLNRIYIAGTLATHCTTTCPSERGIVARITSTGVLDTSYNAAGTHPGVFELSVVVSAVEQRVELKALALTPTEHVVVAGNLNLMGAMVARLLDDGTLDPTFNPTGTPAGSLIADMGRSGSFPSANALGVTVESDNTILLVGQAITGTGPSQASHLALEKLTATGEPDATFAVGGPAAGVAHHPSSPIGFDVAVQSGAKILVSGKQAAGGALVARYDSTGQLDPTFKPGSTPAGSSVVVIPDGNDAATDFALDGAERIVVVGDTVHSPAANIYPGFVFRLENGASTGPTATPAPGATPTVVPTALPTPVCGATPAAGCRQPVVSRKAALFMKRAAGDPKAQLAWSWLKGAATTKADFGDPLTTDGYQLCIYDGTAALIGSATAPAGGFCGPVKKPKPCWKAKKTGFAYADKELTPNGVQSLKLQAGIAKKSSIVLKGKGAALALPTLPLVQPVTVQLRNSSGVCWEAQYSAPAKKNTAGPPPQFKDTAD